MFNRVAYGYNWRPYNYSEFVCDSDEDIANLPTTDNKECAVGSRAYVPSTGHVYTLNSNGKWSIAKGSGGGGGTVPESSIATDDEFEEMIEDVFGNNTSSSAENVSATQLDLNDESISTDDEFNDMMNDVFGDNTTAQNDTTVQNGDNPVDDDL